jgi:hypothetical protein
MLFLVSKLVTGFASTGVLTPDPCACIPLDPSWVLSNPDYAALPNINVYGSSCAGAFRASNTYCFSPSNASRHVCVCPAAWDSMAGTPWYSYCNGDNFCPADGVTPEVSGDDLVAFTHDDVWDNPNWCQVPWCYVDQACPTFVSTSVFADSAGASTIGYSYQSCGGTDCYTAAGWGLNADGVTAPENCPWGC